MFNNNQICLKNNFIEQRTKFIKNTCKFSRNAKTYDESRVLGESKQLIVISENSSKIIILFI